MKNRSDSAERRNSWFVRFPTTNILQMRGRDSLDLLQRISTNDLTTLAEGSWIQTILTNEKGRVIDLVWVGRIESDLLYVVGGARTPHKTKEWIERFIIMEDTEVSEIADSFGHIAIVSGTAFSHVSSLWQFREEWPTEKLLHVLDREAAIAEVLKTEGLTEKTLSEYEDCRIRNGSPAWGHELTEEYNPLEAGLERLISWTKGCYVGQEVIARLDTYKKVQKRLVKLSLSGRITTIPARISSPTGEAGAVTSATLQEPFVGLGYIFTVQKGTADEMYVETGPELIRVTLKE